MHLLGISRAVSFLLYFPDCAPESAVSLDGEVSATCTRAEELDVSVQGILLCAQEEEPALGNIHVPYS